MLLSVHKDQLVDTSDSNEGSSREWLGLALGMSIQHLEGARSRAAPPRYQKEPFELVWPSDWDTFGTPPLKGVPGHVHLGEGPRVNPGLTGNTLGFPSMNQKELLVEGA